MFARLARHEASAVLLPVRRRGPAVWREISAHFDHAPQAHAHHWIKCPHQSQASLKKLVERDELLYLHGFDLSSSEP